MRAPIGWRERDSPKIRRRRIEFERDVESFRHFACNSGNFASDALLGAAVLENQPGLTGKTLLEHNQRAVIADAQSDGVEGYRFPL